MPSACSSGVPRGEGRLIAHGPGRVLVVRAAGGPTVVVDKPITLRLGDRVQVEPGATADTKLPNGASLRLRAGSVVQFMKGPVLEKGDLLVATNSRPVTVATATGPVLVSGASRLRRDLALTVGSYKGNVTVTTADRSLVVPALRQASVAAIGLLPAQPSPITLSSDDEWDRAYLGLAIDLTTQLDQKSYGFTQNVSPTSETNASFFRTALVALSAQPSFSDQLLAEKKLLVGEVLVGAGIALNGAGGFDNRWKNTFDFRTQGADWGVVAVEQAADPNGLLNLLDGAINRSPLVFTSLGASAVPSESPTGAHLAEPAVASKGGTIPTTVPSRQAAGPRGGGSLKPDQPPAGAPGPVVPIPPTPATAPLAPVLAPLTPVLDPFVQLLNQVLGGATKR